MPDWLGFFFTAFDDLQGDRAIGPGGFGPIPFSAIDRYATRFGVDCGDEFDRFLLLIKALDAEWRKMRDAKVKPGG